MATTSSGKASVRKFKQKGNKGEAVAFSQVRVRNERDLVRVCEIDTDEWSIDHWICEVYEMPRKDKKVQMVYDKGVATGKVSDDGKMTVTPLYLVKAWLVRRVAEIRRRDALAQQIKDAKQHAFKYRKMRYKANKNYLFEVDIPDLH